MIFFRRAWLMRATPHLAADHSFDGVAGFAGYQIVPRFATYVYYNCVTGEVSRRRRRRVAAVVAVAIVLHDLHGYISEGIESVK